VDPVILQNLADRSVPSRVPVTHQDATGVHVCHGQRAPHLAHEDLVGLRCGPRICTRRDARWMTNTVYIVTKPRHVQTSVVKKSAPAIASLCARRKACHDVGRSETSGRPCAFRMRAVVERPTRCPTLFSAPWIRVLAPGGIVLDHSHDHTSDFGQHATPPRSALGRPFTGNELPVPPQEGVRRHDRVDSTQRSTSQPERPHGEPSSVVIAATRPGGSQCGCRQIRVWLGASRSLRDRRAQRRARHRAPGRLASRTCPHERSGVLSGGRVSSEDRVCA
jgi:hypothetical protein